MYGNGLRVRPSNPGPRRRSPVSVSIGRRGRPRLSPIHGRLEMGQNAVLHFIRPFVP